MAQFPPALLLLVSPKWGSRGRAPHAESPGRGWVSFASLPQSPPGPVCLSPPHSRIGRKATILVQLLLLAVIGVATAFMPSLELYMVLRFAGATAVAGYTISNVTLREYLGPQAFSHLGVWPHSPDCPCGPCPAHPPPRKWSLLHFLSWDTQP